MLSSGIRVVRVRVLRCGCKGPRGVQVFGLKGLVRLGGSPNKAGELDIAEAKRLMHEAKVRILHGLYK